MANATATARPTGIVGAVAQQNAAKAERAAQANQASQRAAAQRGSAVTPTVPKTPKITVNKPATAAKPATQAASPLTPLTNQQIASEATQQTAATYKPQFQNLTQQANEANNLDAKRAADAKQYSTWLASTSASLQAANSAIMGHLETANQSITQVGAAQQAAVAAGQGNTVSSQLQAETGMAQPGGAQAQFLNAEAGANTSQLNAEAEGSNTSGAIGSSQLGRTTEQTYAMQQDVRQSQVADLDKTLTTLNDDRAKLTSSETADVAKAISSLQTQQTNVAEYNQNFAAAEQKLGVTTAESNAKLGIEKQTANTTAANDQEKNEIAAENAATRKAEVGLESKIDWAKLASSNSKQAQEYQLDVAKLGQSAAKQAYLERYDNAKLKGASKSVDSNAETQDAFGKIDQTTSEIKQLMANGLNADGSKITPQQAFALVASGGKYYTRGLSSTGKSAISPVTAHALPNRTLLNAAYNLAVAGHLNAAQLASLNKIGLYGVRARYPVKG